MSSTQLGAVERATVVRILPYVSKGDHTSGRHVKGECEDRPDDEEASLKFGLDINLSHSTVSVCFCALDPIHYL